MFHAGVRWIPASFLLKLRKYANNKHMKKYILLLILVALVVPLFSFASGTPVGSPVRLLVNGSDSPEPIPFTAPFTVSWQAPRNMRCYTYGMFVPTWDDQAVDWPNMDDNGALPPVGSVKLTAVLLLDGNAPVYYPVLMLGMECIGKWGKTFRDEITVPVLFTNG